MRVRGEWKYLYRAVDKQGNAVDFLLSEHRDIAAAKRFFKKAIERHGAPEKITLDGYAATHTAVHELKEAATLPTNVCVRTSKYLNNRVEQDHRRVKHRIDPLLYSAAFLLDQILQVLIRSRRDQFWQDPRLLQLDNGSICCRLCVNCDLLRYSSLVY